MFVRVGRPLVLARGRDAGELLAREHVRLNAICDG